MTLTPHPPGSALQVILLDVDGTLIDSNDAHAHAWVQALADHGYVVPFDTLRPLIGMGGDRILPQVAGLDPESREAKAIGEDRSAYFLRLLPALRPTPGARELLVALLDRGLELIVATSSTSEEVHGILAQAGVNDLIPLTTTSDDADASKPDPGIVIAALRRSGHQAGQALMIGDTPYDIEAAARARVPCIALRCGGGWTDAELRGAIEIHDDPASLLATLGTAGASLSSGRR